MFPVSIYSSFIFSNRQPKCTQSYIHKKEPHLSPPFLEILLKNKKQGRNNFINANIINPSFTFLSLISCLWLEKGFWVVNLLRTTAISYVGTCYVTVRYHGWVKYININSQNVISQQWSSSEMWTHSWKTWNF
jgi:hypothetical protein